MSEPDFPARPAPDPSLPPPPAEPSAPSTPPASDPWATPSARADAVPARPADAWASSSPAVAEAAPKRRRPVVAAAIVALALVAGGGIYLFLGSEPAQTGPSTALRLAFDRGDQTTYDIHVSMDGSVDLGPMGEQPVVVDMTESLGWKVVEVDDDGVATVRVSIDGVTGSTNGVPVPADAVERSMTFRVAPDGQIIDGNGLAFGAGSSGLGGFPGMDQVTPILPDHDVAPGDEWNKRFVQSFPFGDGKIAYTAHSRFDRYEQIAGVRAAVVTTTYTVPLDFSIDVADLAKAMGENAGSLSALGGTNVKMTYGGSGTFTQTSWLDVGAKQILRSSSRGDFDMTITFPGLSAQLGTDAFRMKATFSLEMTRR